MRDSPFFALFTGFTGYIYFLALKFTLNLHIMKSFLSQGSIFSS